MPPFSTFSPSTQCMTCTKNRWWKAVWGEISYEEVVCEFRSWEKKTCQGGPHITGDEAGGKKKEGGRMLPWRTTSVILVSSECGISSTLPNRNFFSRMFNLIAWHSTMSFFHVGPFQFAWDIRALLCQKWVWTISCPKKKKKNGSWCVYVCVCVFVILKNSSPKKLKCRYYWVSLLPMINFLANIFQRSRTQQHCSVLLNSRSSWDLLKKKKH